LETQKHLTGVRFWKWISSQPRDFWFYGFTFLLVIGLKLSWHHVKPTEPGIFLLPLVIVLRFFLGSPFMARPDGYWNSTWRVLISKDCGGMNYFVIAHCLFVFLNLHRVREERKVRAYVFFFVTAYFLTFMANFSRIIISVILGRSGWFPSLLKGKVHLMFGTLIYFSFLVLGNGIVRTFCNCCLNERGDKDESN